MEWIVIILGGMCWAFVWDVIKWVYKQVTRKTPDYMSKILDISKHRPRFASKEKCCKKMGNEDGRFSLQLCKGCPRYDKCIDHAIGY